ncbi:hypothetical protein TrST_g3399 [Triparma strigata]|uniref:PRP1 splicing factor N-terminal domain-containing protein n=1 Tax=Triparma strigata TaxID=1606541 RepID=A0A9W7BWU7_9STRA|nr:hypothetical protein TrST_g3399 [Triparma strigata]
MNAPTYDGEPPPGYIPGRGRGATGFTTRSDVGSAVDTNKDGEEGQFKDDREDDEADKIYAAIDERLAGRHKKRRIEREEKEGAQAGAEGKISDQFKDLKQKLSAVSEAEWAALPDVGDRSLKFKQKRQQEVFTPLVDTMLADAAKRIGGGETTTTVAGDASEVGGDLTSIVGGLASARNKVISMTLSSISDNVGGQTVVDPKGYVTQLNTQKISSAAEIGDIKKARLLLKSVRDTNPKHGPGWIASARVEEFAKEAVKARALIRQGCEACPGSEDVWLEAVRLSGSSDLGKSICSEGIEKIPNSVKLYLKAADLEVGPKQKKVVLRKAIEAIPNSVKLWKSAIELENQEDARVMLSRAVECVPQSVEMWLALARLETYANARKVLNSARKALPSEVLIWITASRLEEGQNNNDMVDKIIAKSVKALGEGEAAIVKREQWLKEAEACEEGGGVVTARAIVKYAIGLGVEDADRLRTWGGDADSSIANGKVEVARAIYLHMLEAFKTKKSLWLKAVELEKKFGTKETLEERLKGGVGACPKAEVLWLMYAKEKWVGGDVDGAREVLTEAFEKNPNSEAVWLAGAKLELENGETDRARVLLERAREKVNGPKVWMKSALLERECGKADSAIKLLEEGGKRFPKFEKFYMMGGQILAQKGVEGVSNARKWFQKGLVASENKSVVLWILAARLEEGAGGAGSSKARSLLELGRLKNRANEELWLESIRLERRCDNEGASGNLMAQGLQECTNSGLLWAEVIYNAPRVEQKGKSMQAIKNCNDDPHVVIAVAGLFMSERKYEKARKWFLRATILKPEFGDAWVRWYKFEKELVGGGGEDGDRCKEILAKCALAEPKYGELWTAVSKDMNHFRKSVQEKLKICASQG